MLILSIGESLYLFYMFHLCKTTIDLGIGPSPNGFWLKHVTGTEKMLRICPFGRVAVFFLIILLIGRNFSTLITTQIIHIALVIAFLLSLINTNAFFYLLPIFIIEFRNKE